MSEQKEEKVKVRLIRHKWADEIEAEKKQKQKKVFVIIAIIFAFGIGAIFGRCSIPVGQSNARSLSVFDSVYRIMRNDWFFGKEKESMDSDLMNAAINGMVDAQGDPHTIYMSPDEMSSFSSSLENSIVGIGVRYQFVNNCVLVKTILADSPAERNGLQPGDLIIAVDGRSTEEIGEDNIQSSIIGEAGTTVTITVQRGVDVFDLAIVRAEVYTSVTSEIKDGIGVIKISSFGNNTALELKNHLDRMEAQNVSKLILDLRDNGGGYLSTLLSMASFFLDENTLVLKEEFRDGEIEDCYTNGGKYDCFKDLIVLVNENSASCSEVFTAALSEQREVPVVGTVTYGKGTVQVTKAFADGSALKYTIARWLTPSGDSIDGIGVIPDEIVMLDPALYLSTFSFEETEQYFYDSVAPAVSDAEMVLRFLGYSLNRVDGYFDDSMLKALKKFQKAEGLEPSGILDQTTANMLNSAVQREWSLNQDQHDVQLKKALEMLHE